MAPEGSDGDRSEPTPRVGRPDGARLLERLGALPVGALALRALGDAPGVHAVGGAVRDLLLDRTPRELDLVVEGDAIALARAAAERLAGQLTMHERFGTATVHAAGRWLDLAGARRERYPRPGALPDVELGASLADDLPRRDFSVNAIALALADGALTAFPGALEDLAAGRLRVLHERSFEDDPTRLLRLARYAGRLGFAIEPGTAALARAAVRSGALATPSAARIGGELALLVGEDDPVAALEVAAELGIDEALLAAAAPDRVRRALALCPPDAQRPPLLLAAAWLDVGRARLATWLGDLQLPARTREGAARLAERGPELASALAGLPAGAPPSAVRRVLGDAPPEAVALAAALADQPVATGALARRWLLEWRHVRLTIGGDELIAAGAEPGPALAVALRAALDAKLDGRAEGRDQELAFALGALRG